jgi:hypothetical protein
MSIAIIIIIHQLHNLKTKIFSVVYHLFLYIFNSFVIQQKKIFPSGFLKFENLTNYKINIRRLSVIIIIIISVYTTYRKKIN